MPGAAAVHQCMTVNIEYVAPCHVLYDSRHDTAAAARAARAAPARTNVMLPGIVHILYVPVYRYQPYITYSVEASNKSSDAANIARELGNCRNYDMLRMYIDGNKQLRIGHSPPNIHISPTPPAAAINNTNNTCRYHNNILEMLSSTNG